MGRASEGQLEEVRRRTRRMNLLDTDFISGQAIQALLDGEVFRADGSPLDGRIGTRRRVEQMIRAGCHKVTEDGKGMSAKSYKALWPRMVIQPPRYAGRLNTIVLVDLTIAAPAFVQSSNTHRGEDPAICADLVVVPTHPEIGVPLTRYVAFCQLGLTHLGHTVEQCRREFSERGDEVGLVSREGLHLPIQHAQHLRQYAVDLPGSQGDLDISAPCVYLSDSSQLEFDVGIVHIGDPGSGSASRGSQVVPVSW